VKLRLWTLLSTRQFLWLMRAMPMPVRRWLMRRRFNETVRIDGATVVWKRICSVLEDDR
jgi:hypothetical protein